MYETKYKRAESVDAAAAALGAAEDGKLLSGGMTLIPTMKQRLAAPSDLVDITHIDALKGITIDGNDVTIGAATTHADVASSKELAAICPSVCELASHIGDPHVRHRGTIGGSIANNDPAADYPAAMLALNASIMTNKRTITADDFFTGMFETALEDDEIVTAVSFTAPTKGAYAKFPNPASRYAMAGVFVASADNTTRVAVTGAGNDGVFRHTQMEEALNQNFSPDAIKDTQTDESNMLEDIHGSAKYRANLVKVMAKKAISQAG